MGLCPFSEKTARLAIYELSGDYGKTRASKLRRSQSMKTYLIGIYTVKQAFIMDAFLVGARNASKHWATDQIRESCTMFTGLGKGRLLHSTALN